MLLTLPPRAGRPRRPLVAGGSLAIAAAVALSAVGATQPVSAAPSSQRAGATLSASAPRTTTAPAARRAEDYRFVSTPDMFNADLASVQGLARYRGNHVDSWNDNYARAMQVVFDGIAAEQPEDVLVAGDLVEGHWGLDSRHTGIFGPVRTDRQKRAAIRRAAHVYYRQWKREFAQRDLTVHAAVGDHEIGDNDWAGRRADRRFKRATVPLRKKLFSREVVAPHHYRSHPRGPARDTAYAVRLAPEVLLVTVDEFELTRHDVRRRLDPQQQAWLERVLTKANRQGIDWVMVQGHMPVLTPVRKRGSSGLSVEGGRRSPLWRTLARHHVDLYLAGEVHATTMRRADGVTQITHGGMFGWGLTSLLTGTVHGARMHLTIKPFRHRLGDRHRRIWSPDARKGPPAGLVYYPDPPVRGRLVLTKRGRVLQQSGLLRHYRGGR